MRTTQARTNGWSGGRRGARERSERANAFHPRRRVEASKASCGGGVWRFWHTQHARAHACEVCRILTLHVAPRAARLLARVDEQRAGGGADEDAVPPHRDGLDFKGRLREHLLQEERRRGLGRGHCPALDPRRCTAAEHWIGLGVRGSALRPCSSPRHREPRARKF